MYACISSAMFRRLSKPILFLSVPLFVLFFLAYRNHVLVHHENQDNRTSQLAVVEALNQEINTEQPAWKVLWDGTVIHFGTNVIPQNHTFLLTNEQKCENLRNNTVSFVILVESNIVNFDQRQTIRDTWGLSLMQKIGNYRVVFLVGLTNDSEVQNKISFENMIYEDIVQISIGESFNNLTYKSMHMLYWYTVYCSNAKFLFKTDDDIYLHVPNMIEIFDSVQLKGSILCHKNKSRKILRSIHDSRNYLYLIKDHTKNKTETINEIKRKFNKYIIDFQTLPGSLYPDYCSGFGYTMNLEVAQKLLQASRTIPYIGIEDVYITGFCRQKANITIEDNKYFNLKPFIHPIESKCAFEHGRINSNEMTMDDMKKLWTHVNTQGYYCKFNGN